MKTKATQLANQQALIHQLSEENRKQNLEIQALKEQLRLLTAYIYGKRSEKRTETPATGQLSYLDEVAVEPVILPSTERTLVPAHQRKKPGRKPLPANLPRVEVLHDLPEDEKLCECGSQCKRIGEETSEQLNYIPAKLEVLRHIRPKYACPCCEGIETEAPVIKIAPVPKAILPRSIASAGLLAHIVTAKFVDALPFYRQEKQFLRLGIELSRSNMSNWTIQLGDKLIPLLNILKQEVLSGPLINIDETTLQVLKELGKSPSSKSYMWVLRGGATNLPGVYFEYNPSHASSVAQGLLRGYPGIVQSDGYSGYNFIETSKHAGCWAHSRRKFIEVIKAKGKYQKTKKGHADQALNTIGQLYHIEREIKDLSAVNKVKIRHEKSKPLLESFHEWLLTVGPKTPPKGLLGKAINYTLNQWKSLTIYLNHGFVSPDNNAAENAIRPFVVGRKNWLFCDTIKGAKASAALYSLIETAKANQLDPFKYLQTLFDKFPQAETEEELRNLLPQYLKSTIAKKK